MALTRRNQRALKLRVPLSTSNVGPGFDAFGIALNARLEVKWEPAEKDSLERKGRLDESVLPAGRDPVRRGMKRAAILAGQTLPPGKLTMSSSFPPARGLGASGAGIVAGMLLANRLIGNRLKPEQLLAEAIALEGHPENATGSMFGGAHWSIASGRQEWIHLPVTLHRDLRFLLIVPPYPMTTRRSREVLPKSISFARAAAQASRPPILLEGLRKLDPAMIAAGIQDDLHVAPRLKQLAGMENMAEYAAKSGALGVTLSGAGSALLVVTRTGAVTALEARLAQRVKRLWGDSGSVVAAKPVSKGAAFA